METEGEEGLTMATEQRDHPSFVDRLGDCVVPIMNWVGWVGWEGGGGILPQIGENYINVNL